MPEMTASQRRRLDRDQEIAADYLSDMSPAAIMEKHGDPHLYRLSQRVPKQDPIVIKHPLSVER